jgi:hypothetical protein
MLLRRGAVVLPETQSPLLIVGGQPMPTIKFGNEILEITDPLNIEPVSADVLTEGRVYSNVVCLSFAALVMDGDGKAGAHVTSRIRLTLPGAMDLRNILNGLLDQSMPGKDKAN